MAEFLGSTGKKIVINAASSEDAFALKNAIHARIKIPKLDLDSIKKNQGTVLEKIKEVDIDEFIAGIIENLLHLDADKEVNAALMACLSRCTYNSEKITYRTFDNEEVRQDYYDIVQECIKVNILPFYKGLISKCKGLVMQFLQNSPTSQ